MNSKDRKDGDADALGMRVWDKKLNRWRCMIHRLIDGRCKQCAAVKCTFHAAQTTGRDRSWACQKCCTVRRKTFIDEDEEEKVVEKKEQVEQGVERAAETTKTRAKVKTKTKTKGKRGSGRLTGGPAGKKRAMTKIPTVLWCDNHRLERNKCKQCVANVVTCKRHMATAKKCAVCQVSLKNGKLPTWLARSMGSSKQLKLQETESPQ